MHSQQRQSGWLFMKLKEVMMEECYQYRDSEKPQLDAAFNAKQWENCFNMARSKIRISKSCLAPLVRAAKCWSISFKYYDVLATAVSQNPVWEEARVKLNQLLVKRIDEGRFLRTTTNPIYLITRSGAPYSLKDRTIFERRGRRACTIKYEPIVGSDLPAGYVLDQLGLIIAGN